MVASVAELIVRLKDDASARAAEVARALGKISKAEREVGAQSAAIQRLTAELGRLQAAEKRAAGFGEARKGLAAARRAFNEAETAVKRLARELGAAQKPSRELTAAYRRAQREVKAASLAFDQQKKAVSEARSALSGFDGTMGSVVRGEERLRAAIQQTTRALQEQVAVEHKVQAMQARRRARSEAIHSTLSTGAMFAGPAMLAGTAAAAKAGAMIEGERVRMRAAGIPEDEIAAADRQSSSLAAQYPNVSKAEILKLHRESRSVLLHPDEVPALLPTITQAAAALKASGHGEDAAEGLNFAIKAAEVQGIAQDPTRFRDYLDSFVKARQVAGSTITPEAIYEFAKYSKASGAVLSDRFRNTVGVSLAQELGGSTTGVAVNQFEKQMQGGFAQGYHVAAKEFVRLGLANKDDFELNQAGDVKGLKPGLQIPGATVAASDPDRYVYDYLLPAFEKAGIRDQHAQIAQIRRMFPNSNASDLVTKLVTQRESYQNHAGLYAHAQGLNATATNAGDPAVALSSLSTAISTFAGTLTNPVMASAAAMMSSLASGIAGMGDSVAKFQADHPDIATWLGSASLGAGAVAGSVATYGLADGLMSGFGLKSSAVALDASAAALTRAAVVLGADGAALAAGGLGAAGVGAASGWGGRLLAGGKSPLGRLALPALVGSLLWDAPHPSALDATPGEALDGARAWIKGRTTALRWDDPANLKRAYDGATLFRRDPEAARGAAMMRHSADTSSLDDAAAKADEAVRATGQLNQTFVPIVDATSIDAATNKARELKALLDYANGLAIKGPGAAIGQAARGIHADTGIGAQ